MSTLPDTFKSFRQLFIPQFLASWCATHFNDYCARGMQERLEHPPVEDAEFLAAAAWEHWRTTMKLSANPKDTETAQDLIDRAVKEIQQLRSDAVLWEKRYNEVIELFAHPIVKIDATGTEVIPSVICKADSPETEAIPHAIAELTRRLKAKSEVTHMDDEWKALQRAVDALKAVEAL